MTSRLGYEAGKLNDVAVNGNRREIMIQFIKVGKSCSSCHTDFRKKQEK
jgi:cytochrome c556